MILITGCAGFIGFHLSKNFLRSKKKVLGIDCIDNYYPVKKKYERIKQLKKNKNFIFLKLNLNNFNKISKGLKNYKIDTIIHLAAQPGVRVSTIKPHNTLTQNLTSFSNIIEIARIKKIKKFIYASSSSIYGNSKIYPFSEKDYKNVPISVYGATKLSNEIIADAYSKNFNLKCVGLRFFTVYGSYGRPDMAYYSFLDNLRKNQPIKIFNNGNMKRDFTYIDDVIEGIKKVYVTRLKNKHEILNIGKGKPDELMSLVKYLEKYYKKKFKIKYLNTIPNGDIRKTFSNIGKAKKLIGWKPNTTLERGIWNFVKWYKTNHGIN